MTPTQAVQEIIAEPKYYIGIYKQSTASMLVKRIKEGKSTFNKTKEFLTAFGYSQQGNEWIKQ